METTAKFFDDTVIVGRNGSFRVEHPLSNLLLDLLARVTEYAASFAPFGNSFCSFCLIFRFCSFSIGILMLHFVKSANSPSENRLATCDAILYSHRHTLRTVVAFYVLSSLSLSVQVSSSPRHVVACETDFF